MNRWNKEFEIETHAAPETIWTVFRDVADWPKWNAGIEEIRLEGPFAAGSSITMKPPGQDPLRSTLLEVRENQSFVDETRLGDLVVKVSHRLLRHGETTRIVYGIEVDGPEAAEVGAAIAGDFPAVLAALRARVES